jgi:DNA-binding NtrC family response regulator
MSKLSNKIFVVDDDMFHLEVMQQILKSMGNNEVIAFESGMDCLLEIHQNPQIVFLDHQMDIYSGFETLGKIKRHNPNIFVVMVSAQGEIQTAVDSLKYGAFDYLQKDEKLEAKVQEVIQRIEEVRELLKKRKPSLLKSIFSFL